jgi:hypothetical protein
MKRCLLIFPSYVILGIATEILNVLQKAEVVPPVLQGYNSAGFRIDEMKIKESMRLPAFNYATLSGEVLAATVTQGLNWLVEDGVSVAMMVFCGHGINRNSGHSELICSYNQRISFDNIQDIVINSNFSGTLIQIINTCQAGSCISASNSGGPGGDVFSSPVLRRGQERTITLFASTSHTTTFGDEKGSILIDKLYYIINQLGRSLTYEEISSLFKMYRDKYVCRFCNPNFVSSKSCLCGESCQMTPSMVGVFGMPAQLAPVSKNDRINYVEKHTWNWKM